MKPIRMFDGAETEILIAILDYHKQKGLAQLEFQNLAKQQMQ